MTQATISEEEWRNVKETLRLLSNAQETNLGFQRELLVRLRQMLAIANGLNDVVGEIVLNDAVVHLIGAENIGAISSRTTELREELAALGALVEE